MVNIPQGNGNSNRFEVLNEGINNGVALKSTHASPIISQLNSDAHNSSDGFVVVNRRVHTHRKVKPMTANSVTSDGMSPGLVDSRARMSIQKPTPPIPAVSQLIDQFNAKMSTAPPKRSTSGHRSASSCFRKSRSPVLRTIVKRRVLSDCDASLRGRSAGRALASEPTRVLSPASRDSLNANAKSADANPAMGKFGKPSTFQN